MSVFFDHRADTGKNGGVHTEIAWHPAMAVLAVAVKQEVVETGEVQGIVNVFHDEVGQNLAVSIVMTCHLLCLFGKQSSFCRVILWRT